MTKSNVIYLIIGILIGANVMMQIIIFNTRTYSDGLKEGRKQSMTIHTNYTVQTNWTDKGSKR